MEVVLLRKWYILCFLLCLCGHVDAQNKEYWLDEVYQASYCVQDWGMPQKNQAVVWTPSPLTVNGVTYKRGVGVFYQNFSHMVGLMSILMMAGRLLIVWRTVCFRQMRSFRILRDCLHISIHWD